MDATPIKLRSGDWGVKVRAPGVSSGDDVLVTTKAGKSWTATVDRVVWSGSGVHICSTESRTSSFSRSSYYCGYPCPVNGHICSAKNGPCHDCG